MSYPDGYSHPREDGMKSNLVEIDARLVHETEKAWLLDFGDDEKVWIPKSIAEFDYDEKVLTIPENIAQDRGLI